MSSEDRNIIKELERHRSSMRNEYESWEPHFRELRDAIQPSRGRFSLGESRSSSTLNKRLIDATARRGLRTLRSGLMAGMTSPSRPWFVLSLYDEEAKENPEVKAWLHTVQSRMYTVIRGTNTYRMLDACYADLGLFGTFAGLMSQDYELVFKCQSFPIGLYLISDNEDQLVDVLHWDRRMTVRQCVNEFGFEQCSTRVQNQYKAGNHSEYVDIRCAIEPRENHVPGSPLNSEKPFAVYAWEQGQTDKLLQNGGRVINGLLAPRWEVIQGESWSISSPGMEALGDALQLQEQHKDKAMANKLAYDPPMQAPAQNLALGYKAIPGRVIKISSSDIQKGGLRPTHEVRPDISGLVLDIQETQQRIEAAFYVDLFRMASQFGVEGLKNVTATAMAEMHEEKLIALGPVLEGLDHGLLTPLIENVFHYMQEARIIPPAPESLIGAPIKVEFVSLLAQAQKAVGISAIERTIGFVGTLAQLKPEALLKLNAFEAIDEFVDQAGPPPKMIVTTEEAQKQAAQQAQAAQMQQAMEQVQPMANAAKLISEANARSVEASDTL